MFTLTIDTKGLEEACKGIKILGERAIPFAVRDTLNKAAWETFNGSRDEIGRRFFERNTWTRKSVRFKQAKGRDIGRMQSEVGSLQAYMRDQETGFTRHKKGIHGVAIPTSAAAGEGQVRKRTKVIQRRNYLNRIKPPQGRVRGKSRSIVAIKEAVKSGKRTVFINQAEDQWGRPTGFYRVLGGRRKGGRWPKGAKLQMIYSTERATVRTAPHPWLGPATERVVKNLDRIFRDAIERQIQLVRELRAKKAGR
jgi:hypothetical protein